MDLAPDDQICQPLSPVQRDLLLESSSGSGAKIQFLAGSIELGSEVDLERWQNAARTVFESEPGMQLRIVLRDGVPWQELNPQARLITRLERLGSSPQSTIDNWVLDQLEDGRDIETDASFVHALLQTPSGAWHAVILAPHVFFDGAAFRLFFERVAQVYEGKGAGTAGSISELRSAIERASLQVDTPETLSFWRERLVPASPLIWRTKPQADGIDIDQARLLSRDESATIEAFCRRQAFHPADFFLALLAIVLERFRERDGPWVVHTIRSSRTRNEGDVLGCFYRSIPVVIDPRDLALAAPLTAIQKALRKQRRESRDRTQVSMLALQEFQPREGARVIYNYYNFHDVRALGSVRQMSSHFRHRADELHLVTAKRDERFELRLRFNTAFFSEMNLLPRLAAVAAQIAGGAATVGDCDWLLPQERPGSVATQAGTELTSVEEAFAQHGRHLPHAPALTCFGKTLSYSELDEAANRLAGRLIRQGVGPGSFVGVLLDRSFEQVAAILAILKTGGAYVPIDPEYPDERIRFILADSQVPFLIVRRSDAHQGVGDCVQIPFGDVRSDFLDESSVPPPGRASLDDTAYVIYTSGSTGKPKGTLVSRRNVAALIASAGPLFNFDASDRWALLHSCSFDFSVWELFGALALGGRLVIVPSSVARSPTDLAELIDQEGVTVLNQTPSAFYHLAAAHNLGAKTLRYVIFGGEALEPRRLAEWFDKFGDQTPRLVNMYGITETTVHVTWRVLTKADAEHDASLIGSPIPGWYAYLIDSEGRVVPEGCSGEIWVGGAGVAQGYWQRPELTNSRFLDDPFHPAPGRRVYLSGDLARSDLDGGLEYLGRIDDQVKIRGYRVELGEIAGVLAAHPSVREARVLAHPGPEGALLVGYVVPDTAYEFDEADLLRFLRRELPPYMICSRVAAVDHFPLTSHGKLDRQALPVPAGRPPETADFVAARGPTEEIIASLFAEATGTHRVGAHDDFFAIGGHSLAAMRVVARLRDAFGVAGRAGLIFDRPTVTQLAEYVDGHRGTAKAADRPNFTNEAVRDALPLTFAQERIVLLQQMFPEVVAYNFEAMIRFRGDLNKQALRRALQQVVERHDAFRTTFHNVDGKPVQRVHQKGVVSFEQLDFSGAGPEAGAQQTEDFRRESASHAFDLTQLPLLDWRLVKISGDEHMLLHREHHLVHDGWSFVVLLRDLLEFYRAALDDRSPRLPPVLGVGDYAAAHRRWLEGPVAAEQRKYWESRLDGIPEKLDLPTDRSRPAVFSYQGDQLRFHLPVELTKRIRSTARREGVTLYIVLLGAFSLLLSRLSGSEDFAVAAGIANRRWEEVENTVGMLLNNVVFRLQPQAETLGRDFLRQVRDEVLGALANQDLPFGEIVKSAGVRSSPSATPLGNIFFSSYEGQLPDLSLPGLDVELLPGLPNGSAKFDWNIIVFPQPDRADPHGEQVTVVWEYSTDLFERDSVERAGRQFVAAVESLLDCLDRPLADVSVSDEKERRFILAAAEGPRITYPRDATIPELFAAQASARGGAIAARCGSEAITYQQLDQRSARVASGLRAKGVESGKPTAFLLPRGIEAVVVMLGILRAGTAYLPLSPKDPPARQAQLVADSGTRVVVADPSASKIFSTAPCEVIAVESLLTAPVQAPCLVAANDLAAVLFTSGSTGRPKGVEVRHRGIVRLLFGGDYAAFGNEEKVLQLAPLSFDASTFEVWGPLLHGGELVIFPGEFPTASTLGDVVATHGITTMWLNASLFNSIVDENVAALTPLRQLLVGGETLSVPHVERALKALPRTKLINGYGPTENTTFSCCYAIPAELHGADAIPIGRPIGNSRARVLDANRRLAPLGAIGEIYVGGDGLARGYRGLEQLTAEAFVPDPFDPSPEARLYRTGDLGRLRSDGVLEFLGRSDSQLKIRGYRIEPGEIEAALARMPGVASASVLPWTHPARGTSLTAFLVPEKGSEVQPAAVLEALARELPPYLVPSRVIIRASLPTTPHGKLDAKLLAHEASRAAKREALLPETAALNAMEGVALTVLAEVLDRKQMDADQDFFEAGGHSLLVMAALSKLEHALGIRIEPAVFLEGPTARQLARAIERRMSQDSAIEKAMPSSPIVRVSRGQRPLYFIPGGEGGDISLAVYARLALYLPGVAFHGLRVVDRDGFFEGRSTSVEGLASIFIEELNRMQPDGDFDLAGGCIGGIVAYEIARQLEAAGRPPRSVVLMDTIYPSFERRAHHQMRAWCSQARRSAKSWLQASPLSQRIQNGLYRRLSQALPYGEDRAPLAQPEYTYRFINTLMRYRARPLHAPVTLLATEELKKTSSLRRWSEAARGQFTVHDLSGSHWSYIRADIAQTGVLLSKVLG